MRRAWPSTRAARSRRRACCISLLSVVLGLVQKYLDPPLWLVTVIFVPAAFALSWAGTMMSNTFVLSHKGWGLLILAYCCVASVVPVWSLLQPRGYLGGFILYARSRSASSASSSAVTRFSSRRSRAGLCRA